MLEISPELIEKAIAIIGADSIAVKEVETRIQGLTQDVLLTSRLTTWIPEAFAFVFVPHVAKVNLPSTFSARNRKGEWVNIELQKEPIFLSAVSIAMKMFHSGPGAAFKNIVTRSSILDAVNKALNRGESIEGATLSGPALIGIPAETYLPEPKSFWGRLFG